MHLKGLWSDCQEQSSLPSSSEDVGISPSEQLIKDALRFWSDHMISISHVSACQDETREYLFENEGLVSYIENYFLADNALVDIDQVRSDLNALKEIWNGCDQEDSQLTELQEQFEQLIKETLIFWSDHMIPLDTDNTCQQQAMGKLSDPQMIVLIRDLFDLNSFPLIEIHSDMNEPESFQCTETNDNETKSLPCKLNELKETWDTCTNI